MYVVTTNTFHTVRHHPRRPDGPYWVLPARTCPCTSLHLPAPPFDSERTGPGRRPYKRET